jgi:hypothetical protein
MCPSFYDTLTFSLQLRRNMEKLTQFNRLVFDTFRCVDCRTEH